MISVIVPVYNRIELLKKTLDSIFAQTYKDVEVIVVNDGSTDEWPSVQLPRNDGGVGPQALTVIHQPNRGAPTARNRGLAEANGEYVIFWDADVIGEPKMLEKLKSALDEHPQASFSYCSFEIQDTRYKIQKKIKSKKFNVQDLQKNNFIHTTSLIRRKDVVRWDEDLKRFQDWDLWLTMSEMGKTGVWVDDCLFTVLGGGTMSNWLPSFAYKAPFKWLPFISKSVRKYEEAKKIVLQKHRNSNF